jgi:mannose-1-phosphate guanylyltransferase
MIVALVQIMQADPDAVVGLFPSDHYYSDDESFGLIVRSVRKLSTRKLSGAGSDRGRLTFYGYC